MEFIDGIHRNCKYKCGFGNSGIHILDNSSNEPFESITEDIDEIIKEIRSVFSLSNSDFDYVLVYGKDCMVSEYIHGNFAYLQPYDDRINEFFGEAMLFMYK